AFKHAGAGVQVVFSGSTSSEREAVVESVVAEQRKANGGGEGPILVPPYDHPDIILGQGTTGFEMEAQYRELRGEGERFDAVLTPLGGAGLLGGVATWFRHTSNTTHNSSHVPDRREVKRQETLVFGCEPSFQGCNDAEMDLAASPPKRVEHVKSLTIADGLRTPVGILNWKIVSDKGKVAGVFSVSEEEIKMALRLLLERCKVFVEPSAAVPVAVVLFNREFRELVARKQAREEKEMGQRRAWDVGIVLSGGNATVESIGKLFCPALEGGVGRR
ncbi:hypothetical protein LTR66_016961, partial [Elasticomyces elasticus]